MIGTYTSVRDSQVIRLVTLLLAICVNHSDSMGCTSAGTAG